MLRHLLGSALAVATFVPLGVACVRVRARLLPDATGARSRLVEAVLGVSALVVVGQLLGTFGLFRLVVLVPTLLVIAASAIMLCNRARPATVTPGAGPTAQFSENPTSPTSRFASATAMSLVVAVIAIWVAQTFRAFVTGINGTEAARYHLPKAIRFATSGRTTEPFFTDTDIGFLIAYYPDTSELVHAYGISFLGTDFLSHAQNLGLLGIALLAAWCIGRPFGVAPLTAAAAAVVFGGPQMATTQAGNGLNDMFGITFILASVALLVTADLRSAGPGARNAVVLAGLAAGLAAGSKFTHLPAAAMVCLAVVALAPPHLRLKRCVQVGAPFALTGSYWYFRNLFLVGNPAPAREFHLGPITLPAPANDHPTFPLAEVIFKGDAWRDWLLPGLDIALGRWWYFVIGGALLAAIATLRHSRPGVRAASVVALTSFATYILIPQSIGPNHEQIDTFFANVRYVGPALVVGLALLPVLLARSARLVTAFSIAAVVVFATNLIGSNVWDQYLSLAPAASISGAVVALPFAVLLVTPQGRRTLTTVAASRKRVLGAAAAVAVAAVAASTLVVGSILPDRFESLRETSSTHDWAWNQDSSRIAVLNLQFSYVFHGQEADNYVQALGQRTDDGGYVPIESCPELVEVLDEGDYDYLIAWPDELFGTDDPVAARWLDPVPGFRRVEGVNPGVVFEVPDAPDPTACVEL